MAQFLILTEYWVALRFNCLQWVCYDEKDLDKWTKSPKNIYCTRWPCPASYLQKLVNFPFHLTEDIQLKNELSCFPYGEITKGQITKRTAQTPGLFTEHNVIYKHRHMDVPFIYMAF